MERNKMKLLINIFAKFKDEKGITIVYVALLIVVLLGITAFAIDIGYQRVTRNQLQNAADAGALAGARQLGQNYLDKLSDLTLSVADRAIYVAEMNSAAGKKLTNANIQNTEPNDIIGNWDATKTPSFTPISSDPSLDKNAVQLATQTSFVGFFSPILGLNSLNTNAIACAALSGLSEEKPTLPVAIGKSWFTTVGANRGCTTVAFNDTPNSCAGWTSLSTDKDVYKEVEKFIKNPSNIPTLSTGDQVYTKGGVNNQLLKALSDSLTLPVTKSVVIVDDNNDCGNLPPNDTMTVIGFATITITSIATSGNPQGLIGYVDCSVAFQGRGGGFYGGTYGSIPGLVK